MTFEVATRKKWRFPSVRGELNIEQLWDLRLESKDGFDLDAVAKAVNAELRSATEESFVATRSAKASVLQEKLDLIKYIIGVKLSERDEAKAAAANRAKLDQLYAVREAKLTEQLQSQSIEDIDAQIAALSK